MRSAFFALKEEALAIRGCVFPGRRGSAGFCSGCLRSLIRAQEGAGGGQGPWQGESCDCLAPREQNGVSDVLGSLLGRDGPLSLTAFRFRFEWEVTGGAGREDKRSREREKERGKGQREGSSIRRHTEARDCLLATLGNREPDS